MHVFTIAISQCLFIMFLSKCANQIATEEACHTSLSRIIYFLVWQALSQTLSSFKHHRKSINQPVVTNSLWPPLWHQSRTANTMIGDLFGVHAVLRIPVGESAVAQLEDALWTDWPGPWAALPYPAVCSEQHTNTQRTQSSPFFKCASPKHQQPRPPNQM